MADMPIPADPSRVDDVLKKYPDKSAAPASDNVDDILKKYLPASTATKPSGFQSFVSGAEDAFGGAMQGAIYDPITGINQLLEHVSNNKIGLSDATKKELEDFKNKYTGKGHTAGNIGRGVGTVGSALLPAAWGVGGVRSLGLIPRMTTGAGLGALAGAAQPVEGEGKDFKKQKQGQILAGAGTGALAGPIGAGAAAYGMEQLVEKIGWHNAIPLFIGLGTLASRYAGHHPWGIMGSAARGAHRLLDRPGGQYATGRAVQSMKPGDAYERLDKND